MYAHVTVELVRHPGVLRLPVRAVGALGDSPFVFVVADGRLIERPVSIGINDGQYVEVTSGLSGNELVVGAMRPTLQSGESVEYRLPNSNVATNAATPD